VSTEPASSRVREFLVDLHEQVLADLDGQRRLRECGEHRLS
jgi:hypothetical protein